MARSPKSPSSKRAASRSRLDLHNALDPVASAIRSAFVKADEAASAPPVAPKIKKELPVSPLAPKEMPEMPEIDGVTLAAGAAGIKYKGRDDVLVIQFDPACVVAGVFTQSQTAAAPVTWCRDNLDKNKGGEAGLLIVNAGNANAFTGREGARSCKAVAQAGAKLAKCRQKDVFLASTGVIGEPLDPTPIIKILPKLVNAEKSMGWEAAAKAIMTTDTFPKTATATAKIDGVPVTINGITKGSGMIAPNMATMLAFIATDANIPGDVLQTLLLLGTRDTFNTVTVDSDTSTNDAVLAFSTGKAEHEPVTRPGDRRLTEFRKAWHKVMEDLALQLVRDGEGATKLIQIHVTGADTARGAQSVAQAIANSPLVKTAIAGEDANWGRVVMAAGKAGVTFDQKQLSITFGGLPVAAKGARHTDYDEKALSKYMKGEQIDIEVSLGSGSGVARVWTCDLTHGYIDINADYRS